MLTHKIQSKDLIELFMIEELIMTELIPYCNKHNKEPLVGYTIGDLFTLVIYIVPLNNKNNNTEDNDSNFYLN
jgi:hypothetical protein